MPLALVAQTLLAMLLRRRFFILGMFTLVTGALAALILTSQPEYVARGTLLAKIGREHTLRSYGEGEALVPVNYGQDQIVASAIEIMRAGQIAQVVVRDVGRDRLFPEPPRSALDRVVAWLVPTSKAVVPGETVSMEALERAAAERILSNLVISPVGRSNVIEVRFSHADPVIAAETVNAFVAVFQSTYRALYSENLVPVLEADVARAAAWAAEAQASVEAFEIETFTFSVEDGELERLLARRSQLQAQDARLRRCCGDSAAAREIQQELAQLERRLPEINERRSRLSQLVRELDRAEGNLEEARRRLHNARNMQNLDNDGASSIQVMGMAYPPREPAAPGRGVLLGLASGFALALASSAGLGLELVRRRFSSASELQAAFGLPVLADIPRDGEGGRA